MASLSPLTGTLDTRKAAHLLRRTSYKYTKAKVDNLTGKTAAQAATAMLTTSTLQLSEPLYGGYNAQTILTPPVKWMDKLAADFPAEDFVLRRFIVSWWINEAMNDSGIGHKMELFYHQYMPVTVTQTTNTNFFDYLGLIRFHALGNFKKLALKMIKDYVMLRYLNNQQNSANNPNENFAREFMELFTIGKGPQIGAGDYTNYTEDDIVAAAKVLTGWRGGVRLPFTDPTTGVVIPATIDPETNLCTGTARTNSHNWEAKTFSSHFQNFTIPAVTVAAQKTVAKMTTELQQFVDMIFNQPETAKNLCRRYYRFFIARKITAEIETDIIEPLAQLLIANNFETKPVLEKLLTSKHFYDADDSANSDEIYGALIKSPLELSLQAMTFFGIQAPNPTTQNLQHYSAFLDAGVQQRMLQFAAFPLYYPSDVAGYPAYYQDPDYNRAWFHSSSIIARYKLPQMLLTGKRVIGNGPNTSIGIKLNIGQWLRDSNVISIPEDPFVVTQELLRYLMPEEVDDDRFQYFYHKVFLDDLPSGDWTYEWQNYLNTNSSIEVDLWLGRLITGILYSPEYQTF
jgi:uncharacterized protein (DUF1800 family)